MARSRNIKPSIMENEDLAELDPIARLLFIYLWMLADREGRLEDRPKRIAGRALPYDRAADVDDLLQQLHVMGFILRYSINECKYIQIVSFEKHQHPHCKEAPSTIQAPDKNSASTVQVQGKNETSPADSLLLIPDSLLLIPDTGLPLTDSGATPDKPAKGAKEYSSEFEEAWVAYPKRPGASRSDSFKAWSARIKAGADPQTILAGVIRYANYCSASGTDAEYIKQPATFFGPGEHYLSDWTVPVRSNNQLRMTQSQINAQAFARSVGLAPVVPMQGDFIEGECYEQTTRALG